ncbi:DUF2894 domain-containing protein [Stenotrophomonas nitritireducens]|uniref:DUF2894 domain-containing protein n=1 Tax=Stenotrophomonas nitritireducens TaxID=83617 RepID=UPI003D9720A2
MPADGADVHARLEAWRRQGAERIDPVRFALMTALAQRAARYGGAVRQRLDARLQVLADAYAALPARTPVEASPRGVGDGPLKQLLEQLGNGPRPDASMPAAIPLPVGESGERTPAADIAAPMPVLDEFQQLWTRIRIDGLLRQCLDGLPEDAGPLHSSVLTYRAMALMREVCPDYLQHFVAYTDALSWLEQLCGSTDSGNDTEPTAVARKPARSPRRRKQQ